MTIFRSLWIVICLLVLQLNVSGQQYQLNGNARANSCNCYTLTDPATFQSGSAWNKTLFDLTNPFDFRFSVFLGCQDATGADGIAFMLQQMSTSLGASGGGMGFDGVSPSIGILLDTWQNTENNDPAYDHISIQANGRLTHGSDLAGPVRASATSDNIEDCAWHILRITWNPVTQQISAYFDGNLRVQAQIDLVGTIFNNNPKVYWGFTAATGGSYNLQQFCTALAPMFNTDFTNNTACTGSTIHFTNTSESFAPIQAYYWDFGDGTHSTLKDPPPHLYAAPGLYTVKLALKGFDGCDSDTLRTVITIGDPPVAGFDIFDTCAGIAPRIIDRSSVNVGSITQWTWEVDNVTVSNAQQPQLNNLSAGPHTIRLTAGSNNGCPAASVQKSFTILPTPRISASADDGCVNIPVSFTGQQLDNATTITQWDWSFGDNQRGSQQQTQHIYRQKGNYTAQVTAVASNGCRVVSDNIPLFINQASAWAGNDTVFIKDVPFQLQGSGGGSYLWTPATGLNNAAIANPTGVLQDDITYTLKVTTPEGCEDTDDIHITVFKESRVYVPGGFTPNQDGLNDILKPYLIGIRSMDYFTVYNRWGQIIYSTKDLNAGWNGQYKGMPQPTGVYVWRLRATDYVGKVYELKGTSTLIR